MFQDLIAPRKLPREVVFSELEVRGESQRRANPGDPRRFFIGSIGPSEPIFRSWLGDLPYRPRVASYARPEVGSLTYGLAQPVARVCVLIVSYYLAERREVRGVTGKLAVEPFSL